MIQFYHFCLCGCQRVTPTRLQVSKGAMRREGDNGRLAGGGAAVFPATWARMPKTRESTTRRMTRRTYFCG